MRTRRLRIAASAVVAAAGFLAGTAGCRQRGTPDPNIRMAISHERDETAAPAPAAGSASSSESQAGAPGGPGGSESGRVPVPTRLEVPSAVQEAFSGIRLAWKDATTGKGGTIDVPLGGAAPIPSSPLEVRADVYLPAFTMSADAITSTGVGEENPAARIAVQENGKDLFAGWIFNRFPDVHPFQHPRFSLKLEGGIARGSAASADPGARPPVRSAAEAPAKSPSDKK